MIRFAIACAMLAAPSAALAQSGPAQPPVTVEIVASGEVTVPAQRFRISVTLTAKGDTEEAAKAALAASRAGFIQSVVAQGVREARPDSAPKGNSFMSIFAGLAGRSKPTMSMTMDSPSDDPDAKPQSVASETVDLDAPTRAAAANVRKTAEAMGGTASDEVIGLLDDYAGASRRAKADALVKARADALAYGEALGLRQAVIVRISEKQDIIAGSIGFVSQIIGMFAPKSGSESNDVTVRESLTVEFRLSR
jgi:uncharacterized protein YggE